MAATENPLCQVAAAPPPHGGPPNFVDPPTLGPTVIAVGVILAVISTGFTIPRLFVNRTNLRSADYFTCISCIFNFAYTGTIFAQQRYYRHFWDVPICWFTADYLRLPFVQVILFCPVFFFPKAAILLLYRQLFGVNRSFRIAINIGLVFTFLTYISNIPLAAIYAAPRPGQSWDDLLYTLKDNQRSFSLAGAVQSMAGTAIDFYIFILPLPTLAGLRLAPRRKWQLIGVFSTGLIGIAASIVSLVYKLASVYWIKDETWLAGLVSMCTIIETNITIIVGCMPSFAQFVKTKISHINWNSSTLVKSLRTRIRFGSRSGDGSTGAGGSSFGVANGESSESELKAPTLHTIGSEPKKPRKKNYYELTDIMLTRETTVVSTLNASREDHQSQPGKGNSPSRFV